MGNRTVATTVRFRYPVPESRAVLRHVRHHALADAVPVGLVGQLVPNSRAMRSRKRTLSIAPDRRIDPASRISRCRSASCCASSIRILARAEMVSGWYIVVLLVASVAVIGH
jgi:hypothetical protein